MDIQQMKHDLRRDIQNIMSVLKIINSELKVEDPEIKTLIDLALQREASIHNHIKGLTEQVRGSLSEV